MKGRAHQCDAHGLSVLDELRQLFLSESFDPCPQIEVRSIWSLSLQTDQPLDGIQCWQLYATQQHLPRKQGAVQGA
ncbi:hypothetical protein [Paenibacillus agricola]|uniref:hypothetical protein n=1 Tax=Paenibacillus agricola TaxID=2716264 RepID=UPI00289325EA|nr:hypothetical protein [Paenibacillus agricola]